MDKCRDSILKISIYDMIGSVDPLHWILFILPYTGFR